MAKIDRVYWDSDCFLGYLQQRDSIHVATALLRTISKLHTFDERLLKLDGKLGNPKLCICKPDIQGQRDLGALYEEKEGQGT